MRCLHGDTIGRLPRRSLGVVEVANNAQVGRRQVRYAGEVTPPTSRRRHSLRVISADRAARIARVEHEDRLWHGMKDDYTYVVPERGGTEVAFRGRTYSHGAATLLLKQPGEIYRELRRDGPGTYDVVFLSPSAVDAARAAVAPRRDVVLEPLLDRRDPRARALLALHAELRDDDTLAATTLIAEAALALTALPGATTVGGERPAVRRARAYLLERLSEPVRLDELADHVRLDKHHLIRAFRAEVGVPPYEFLTHARVHRARELLRQGVASGTVASLVGYCDQSQLNRHFVRLTGTSPGRYARAHRPRDQRSPADRAR